MFNHRLTRRMVITFFCLLTFPVAAQDRYFGDLDGFWDEAFSWEGGVVPSAGENAFLVRPYFGFVPAIQPLLVDFRSATDPELGTLVIESSNWLIQNELPGLDQLTSFREIIGGYDGELLGTVESVDNPSHRSSHIQNGGTNRVVFLTIGGVPGSGGRYLLGGGFLRAGSVVVGNAGIGEIHQTEGFLDSSSFVLGRFASGSGTLTIDGGRLEVTDSDLSVGPVGFGNIAHSGDAEVLVDRDLLLGSTENSTSWGEYEFSSTSFLNVGGDIYIGRGNFRHMGGDVFIGGDLVVEPAGAYLINGASTLEMTGAIDLAGQVGQQGGQMNVASTVNISAGLYSQSAGTHRVGQSLKVGNEESRTGFYRLQDGTMDVMQDTYIGSNGGFGEFTHENGTHIVNGSLVLGYEADFETFPNVIGEIGIGSYTITDGEVRADRLHMGDSGLGEFPTFEFDQFTQDGGVVRLEKEVVIGFGVYELNDGELYSAPVDATDPLRLLYENNALIGPAKTQTSARECR